MSKFVTMAAVAAALLMSAAPASAQDWISSIIAQQKAQSGGSESRTTQKASKPATRVASSQADSDDGSRPQRKSATAARPRESLSGSGGETGVASYYWQPQALASGGRFNPDAMTAAHKTLPFGTRVRVIRLDNGNSVDVVINDRGPYIAGRIIDLSRRAAQDIGMTGSGITRVRVAILGRG
jgi:rare lipoprotein A